MGISHILSHPILTKILGISYIIPNFQMKGDFEMYIKGFGFRVARNLAQKCRDIGYQGAIHKQREKYRFPNNIKPHNYN